MVLILSRPDVCFHSSAKQTLCPHNDNFLCVYFFRLYLMLLLGTKSSMQLRDYVHHFLSLGSENVSEKRFLRHW